MRWNRRQFLIAAATLAGSRLAESEDSSFSLEYPAAKMNVAGAYTCAVYTNASCILQMHLSDEGNRVLVQGEPKRLGRKEAAPVFSWQVARPGERLVRVIAQVQANGLQRPHLAGVLWPERTIAQIAGPARLLPVSTAPSLTQLREIASSVAFVQDPAPRGKPGHFIVQLDTLCDLSLEIWNQQQRRFVAGRSIPHLPSGPNAISWELRDPSGKAVEPGEYVATLTATPLDRRLSDTMFFSSFQVL